jgi:hypothetical protein
MRKQDFTYDDKLGQLRLEFGHPKNKERVFIFVEGESDVKIFRKFFNSTVCKVEHVPGGNSKVETCTAAMTTLHPLVFGIRDADFLRLEAVPYQKQNMFLTDFHDMEMTMVATDEVFGHVVAEHADVSHEICNDTTTQAALRLKIMQAIEDVSYLKWLNAQDDLNLQFADIGFVDLDVFSNAGLPFEMYFNRVVRRSPNAKITDFSVIQGKIAELRERDPHPFYLCNGHDFMKTLAHYMRQNWQTQGIKDDKMAGNFRLAFTKNHWQQTQLYAATSLWAAQHDCIIH